MQRLQPKQEPQQTTIPFPHPGQQQQQQQQHDFLSHQQQQHLGPPPPLFGSGSVPAVHTGPAHQQQQQLAAAAAGPGHPLFRTISAPAARHPPLLLPEPPLRLPQVLPPGDMRVVSTQAGDTLGAGSGASGMQAGTSAAAAGESEAAAAAAAAAVSAPSAGDVPGMPMSPLHGSELLHDLGGDQDDQALFNMLA
jgi:hypothetical protein